MRIVFLVPDTRGQSGWSRYARDLGAAFVRQGHDVYALVHQASSQAPCPEYAVLTRATTYLGSSIHRYLGGYRVRRVINHIRPDVVHIIAEPYAQLLPSLRGPWKTCMTVHGTYAVSPLAAPGAVGRRARDAFIQLDGVISVSAFTKGYMHRAAPSLFNAADLERKIRIIHNGVDLSRAGRHAPGEAGIKRIIGVGAVKARKGYKEAIDALAIVRQTSAVHVAYDIIGSLEEDPQYVARLRAHIHDLGLSQCVRLRGIVTEMELREAYASADLFLLLSLHEGFSVEGFGLVFLEANSWGVPVIGPTTGGCPEAISDGVSGYVCDPHDARSAAEHMRAILERRSIDPETCLRWAQAHSSDVMAAAIAEYYRTL